MKSDRLAENLKNKAISKKLEQDLEDLERSYQDTRVAYNLFVTAEHLPDWLDKRYLVRKHAILRITSHLANGAKHSVFMILVISPS